MKSVIKTLKDKIHSLEIEVRLWSGPRNFEQDTIDICKEEIKEHHQALFFIDNAEKSLPIRDIKGCWIVSNNERPTEDGIYTTIDSRGIEGEALFDNKHWILKPGSHPVQIWVKPNKLIKTYVTQHTK